MMLRELVFHLFHDLCSSAGVKNVDNLSISELEDEKCNLLSLVILRIKKY